MKKIIFVSLLFLMFAATNSCKKNFLDKTPDEDMTIDSVFASRQYAERFLTSAYFNLPEEISFNDWWGRNPFVGASDEMEITWTYPFSHQMTSGAWNASNIARDIYHFNMEGLRKVNIFIENIDKTPFNEKPEQKEIFKGEATFLRAFFHFLLLRTLGPIPIADHSYKPDEDFSKIRRASFDESVAFIVKDCDAAASKLPMKVQTPSVDLGRATKAAALALKARVLLYAASPLFNGNPDYANLKDQDGKNLFAPNYDAQKWQIAAAAAKDCIDQVEAAGYHLYYSATKDPMRNYYELFIKRWNDEILFARNQGVWDHQERCTSPNGMGGWSGYCPTQEQVDAYQMADGSTPITGYNSDGTPIINAASGYQETGYATIAGKYYPDKIRNMYANREPRFYASINFSGQNWRGRRIEFWNTGLDGRAKGGPDYTATGYLMKKFSDEDVDIVQGRFTMKTWNYFRLGELYLNYAEALNESQGPIADVYKYVNAIRTRAGMPSLPSGLGKDAMREKIHHERRIELAFETHRYFDEHRWKIAQVNDNKNFYTMNIGAGTSLQDDAFYKRIFFKKRVFETPKHYLWPIPQTEIDKTPTLTQNPGW